VHQIVAGQRREGRSPETLDVLDPSTGETVEQVRLADASDVDDAVRAARAAFPAWSAAPPVERSAALTRMAALLDERAGALARTETRQTGKPIRLSTGFDVPGTVDNVAFFAGAARHLEGKAAGEYSGDHTSYVRREAIGVVGSVAPWNYPLQMAAWKILPAIAAGNTEAGPPGARWQGPVPRLRRRGRRGGGARRGRRRADQHRAGLHGRDPGVRAAAALRRLRRRCRRRDGHRRAR
jgi:betaine-aldehyde dehydrogenase